MDYESIAIMCSWQCCYTVNNKSYVGENFHGLHGFHGFPMNCKVFSTNFISAILSVNIYTKSCFHSCQKQNHNSIKSSINCKTFVSYITFIIEFTTTVCIASQLCSKAYQSQKFGFLRNRGQLASIMKQFSFINYICKLANNFTVIIDVINICNCNLILLQQQNKLWNQTVQLSMQLVSYIKECTKVILHFLIAVGLLQFCMHTSLILAMSPTLL